MKADNYTSLERRAPRTPAHLRGHSRRSPGGMNPLRLRISDQNRRRAPQHLRRRRAVATLPVRTPSFPVADVRGHDHDTAIESIMPKASARTGRGLSSAVTLPVAAVVACIYIEVPLALFTHDFSDRLLASLVPSVLVLAAAFGGVVRVLRATTRATASHDLAEVHTAPEVTRLSSPIYAHWAAEPGDYRQMAEA